MGSTDKAPQMILAPFPYTVSRPPGSLLPGLFSLCRDPSGRSSFSNDVARTKAIMPLGDCQPEPVPPVILIHFDPILPLAPEDHDRGI